MSYRMPSGIPAYVRQELGLVGKSGRVLRAGQWMPKVQAARLIDAARTSLDTEGIEYEIGVDYDAADGVDHDVSFNARLFLTGRTMEDVNDAVDTLDYFERHSEAPGGFNAGLWFARGITEQEARAVLAEFAYFGRVPGGFEIEAVDWKRTSYVDVPEWKSRRTIGRARDGDAADLANFRAIMLSVGKAGFRVGTVKRNRP